MPMTLRSETRRAAGAENRIGISFLYDQVPSLRRECDVPSHMTCEQCCEARISARCRFPGCEVPCTLVSANGGRGTWRLLVKNNRRLLARQWQLIQLLNASRFGLRVDKLQEETSSSRATVYRDLALLQEAGVPIERQTVNGEARYRMLRPSELPDIGLTALQISALYMARAELEPLSGTGLVSELDALLARCRPPQKQPSFHFADRANDAGKDRSAVLRGIEHALARRCRARIEYRAASRGGKRSVLLVEPLLVSVTRGDPYMRAYCVERDAERTYKLARITKLELTNDAATYTPTDPPARAFDHSVKVWSGERHVVKVRLDPNVAWLASEYPLVKGQRVEAGADGGVTVVASVSGIVEAMRWVLSWGGTAEALEPPELREAARAELLEAIRKYEGPGVVRAKRRTGAGRQNKLSQVS
jgi:predicted DNA-binding transcriptional regulator YafY